MSFLAVSFRFPYSRLVLGTAPGGNRYGRGVPEPGAGRGDFDWKRHEKTGEKIKQWQTFGFKGVLGL